MKNANYWRGRFSILEKAAHQKAGACVDDLEKIYRDAERTVQADLERWYGRFAANNGISLTDARKMLTNGQLEEFRWTVERYIKAAQRADLSPEWLKKLENASARFHVSRLETIQLQIQQQIELLYDGQLDSLDGLLRDVVSNGYTHTVYEIHKGLGLGWDVTALNQRKLETLLSKPWTADGKTFRDRCWENKANLVSGVQSTLTQGLLRGDGLQKITDRIKNQFNVSRYKAGRLAHTETTYFNAQASKEVYKNLDIERVEILETLDRHTCDLCGGLDGTVIPITQYEPGVTVPPFHPNCRGTTCPYYDDMDGERAARNADGEVYYVPADMSYETWKKTFIDQEGDIKDGLRRVVKSVATGKKVISFNKLPKEFQQQFRTGLAKAAPEAKALLRREYHKADYILGHGKRSYYRGLDNIVRLGANTDPSTVAHELFHRSDRGGKISTGLSDALARDCAALNKVSGGDIKEYLIKTYPAIFTRRGLSGKILMSLPYRGIADILNGLSGGKVEYGFGHSSKYWADNGALEAEAWAQFGRVLYENDSTVMKIFQMLFPNFFEGAIITLKGLI